MYSKHPQHARLAKALLMGAYFVLFAVHLHFRYAQPALRIAGNTTAAYHDQPYPSKTYKVQGWIFHVAKAEGKLNKRFMPQQVYESLPAIDLPPIAYDFVHPVYPVVTPALCSTPTDHCYQRGPPAVL